MLTEGTSSEGEGTSSAGEEAMGSIGRAPRGRGRGWWRFAFDSSEEEG